MNNPLNPSILSLHFHFPIPAHRNPAAELGVPKIPTPGSSDLLLPVRSILQDQPRAFPARTNPAFPNPVPGAALGLLQPCSSSSSPSKGICDLAPNFWWLPDSRSTFPTLFQEDFSSQISGMLPDAQSTFLTFIQEDFSSQILWDAPRPPIHLPDSFPGGVFISDSLGCSQKV